MEEWKSIPGYEGLYEVSNLGRVRSLDRYIKYSNGQIRLHKGRILNPSKDTNGYLKVLLKCNTKCKTITVHRLVALTFLPNPDNLPCVNHKDEDKTNNRVENLEWCTQQYNLNYNGVLKKRSQRMKENGIYERRSQIKRIKHPELIGLDEKEYIKEYRKKTIEQYREYQREYKREYRKRKRGQ